MDIEAVTKLLTYIPPSEEKMIRHRALIGGVKTLEQVLFSSGTLPEHEVVDGELVELAVLTIEVCPAGAHCTLAIRRLQILRGTLHGALRAQSQVEFDWLFNLSQQYVHEYAILANSAIAHD